MEPTPEVRPTDHVIFQPAAGGGGLVINTTTGEQYVLDSVAADMWRALIAAGSRAGAVAALLRDYDVERGELESDFDRFVADLTETGLLTRG